METDLYYCWAINRTGEKKHLGFFYTLEQAKEIAEWDSCGDSLNFIPLLRDIMFAVGLEAGYFVGLSYDAALTERGVGRRGNYTNA